MKTFVITLTQTFQSQHPRKGEPTGFKDKLLSKEKIHTIRANYKLWLDRFRLIDAGQACLSIRQWSGKPYRSKQIELARLTKEDGIGIQCLSWLYSLNTLSNVPFVVKQLLEHNMEKRLVDPETLAKNDGLDYEDWSHWFEQYDKYQPMAIIHFTPFRY